jgi:hypothetical protein
MSDQFTREPVDFGPFEIIELLTVEIENGLAIHYADVDTLAVEDVAAHDRPHCTRPPRETALIWRQWPEKSISESPEAHPLVRQAVVPRRTKFGLFAGVAKRIVAGRQSNTEWVRCSVRGSTKIAVGSGNAATVLAFAQKRRFVA